MRRSSVHFNTFVHMTGSEIDEQAKSTETGRIIKKRNQ